MKKYTACLQLLHLAPPSSFLPAAFMSLCSSLAAIILMSAAAWIIASAALHPPLYTLALAITLVRAAGIGRAIFRYLDRWLSHRATFHLLTRLRAQLYLTAEKLLPLREPGTSQGALLHDLTAGIDCLRDFYLKVLAPPLLTLLLTLCLSACLLPITVIPALLLFAAWFLSLLLPILSANHAAAQETTADKSYRSLLLDVLGGLTDIQSANAQAIFLCRLNTEASSLTSARQKICQKKNLADTLASIACSTALAGSFAALIPCVVSGTMSGIELAVYLLAIQTVLTEFQPLPDAARAFSRTLEAVALLEPSLPHTASVILPSCCSKSPKEKNVFPAIGLSASPLLSAEQITFAYKGQPPVLRNQSFSIQKGEKIAIIGESGSGKTTLFHLLLRLWEPDSGKFLFGDHAYTDYTIEELRSFFTASTQDGYIFSDSIRRNFLCLHPGITDKEIWHALDEAQLSKAIQALPQGIGTPLGENGRLLSGGQRQRFLIAQALASQAPVLLLDEPTAGLDKKTAHDLLDVLLEHQKDRTLILITHDLPLLSRMDRTIHISKA
jgi:thiol reductant ABC exporter CydC subunit